MDAVLAEIDAMKAVISSLVEHVGDGFVLDEFIGNKTLFCRTCGASYPTKRSSWKDPDWCAHKPDCELANALRLAAEMLEEE